MSVVSKNLYDLLGNDPELDPDREPEPPTKAVDKPAARSGKRNAAAEPKDAAPVSGRGGRQDNSTGNERAYRDRDAGAQNNRSKPTDDGLRQDRHPDRTREPNEHRNAGDRGRGSRGGRRGYAGRGMAGGTRTGRDDRHSRTNVGEHDKQAAHGWGAETGEGELADETAGEAIAKADEKADGYVATEDTLPVDENGVPADQLPAEPEDKTMSYEQYLALQLEKKAALNDRPLEVRKANEGSSKKFPEGKAYGREGASEDFIAGSGGKAKRERERKAKNLLDIDQTWKESEVSSGGGDRGDRGDRGGARGGRGGRGRGEFRGGEGRGRGGRGRGRGGERGEFRGGERGGPRGGPRGGQGNAGAIKLDSANDFPSLGA